jgi:hypothetical protein
VTDRDIPNIRMPIRMLSVNTPDVTARTEQRTLAVDTEFAQPAEWIVRGRAPISAPLASFVLPKLATGAAGRLQREQGMAASAFAKQNINARLSRPGGSERKLFIRTADSPFDNNNRLLAYIAPDYSAAERQTMTRRQRATFNLDLDERVRGGLAGSSVTANGTSRLTAHHRAARNDSTHHPACSVRPGRLLAYQPSARSPPTRGCSSEHATAADIAAGRAPAKSHLFFFSRRSPTLGAVWVQSVEHDRHYGLSRMRRCTARQSTVKSGLFDC